VSSTVDLLQRPLRDLRISVTDRCNLRCPYCMPREVFGSDFRFMDRSELLSLEEIVRIARAGVEHGVRKVRLTGGEPLLRRELASLVEMLAQVRGIEDIALTTNGTALAAHARALAQAGLDRVTVSLDALDEEVFHSMSDTRYPLARVLAGIDAAHDAGLSPVKINMVVRRGVNDHCVLEMAEHFRGRPETLRFIEYMDVGESNDWDIAEVVPADELLASIESRWPLQRLAPGPESEVATRWAYSDGAGEIGVIHSVSRPFCGGCTRARLSAEGTLYTCLFANHGTDLRALLRGGADDAELAQRLAEIWGGRSDRYSELRALRQAEREPRSEQRAPALGVAPEPRRRRAKRIEMSYIGG
jgi:cyclic pyranopterin phosphate synthase